MTKTMPGRHLAPRRYGAPVVLLTALTLAAVLAGVTTLVRFLEPPDHTDFVVRNDTVWNVELVIRTGATSELRVATVDARAERALREVLVPGSTWRFIWRFNGTNIATSTVTDDELRRDGFRLAVPPAASEALDAAGTPPSP